MLEKTAQDFIADADNLLVSAVVNDDFVKIKTRVGNAVLVSETEWNIMVDAFKALMHAK